MITCKAALNIGSELDKEQVLPPHSPAQPGNPSPSEWVLPPSSPADPAVRPALHLGAHAMSPARLQRVASALQPRRLACRHFGSPGRPARSHPPQLQRVETPSQPRRVGRMALPLHPGPTRRHPIYLMCHPFNF